MKKSIIDYFVNKKLQRDDAKRRVPDFNVPPKEKWLDLFLNEEYGVRPKECDTKLKYEKIDEKEYAGAIGEKIKMFYRSLGVEFHLWTPKNSKNVKCFFLPLHPSAYVNKNIWEHPENISDYCPINKLIARGFAVLILLCGDVAKDDKDGKQSGIFKEMNCAATPSSWGVLSAWAWAISKCADYLEKDKRFDPTSFAVVGHSRGGKTALLAGVTDNRFKLVISNNSGNSGAATSRNNKGETIANIVKVFPYWFCDNYKKYANNENALPFDQFMLLALIAPRYCYVTSATRDAWADPVGELLSCKKASPYFEQQGVLGLVAPEKIEPNVAYDHGHLAYCRRTGKHELSHIDWQNYMNYFEKIK